MRARVTFAKTEAMRYTGHLDLARALERTLRRAGLPLSYTQGFTPRARLHLACALPLGFTSCAEIADVWLDDDVELPELLDRLQRAAPPGLLIQAVATVAENAPALQTQVLSAEYSADLHAPPRDLAANVASLLGASSFPSRRRGKDFDLRPLIEGLHLQPADGEGVYSLRMRLSAREAATGRPEEVLTALDLDPLAVRVERIKLILI